MKAQGTKIKIGLSSSRSDKSRTSTTTHPHAHSLTHPLDTPCAAATIFELCKTKNDPVFHKKRKSKAKLTDSLTHSLTDAGTDTGTGAGTDTGSLTHSLTGAGSGGRGAVREQESGSSHKMPSKGAGGADASAMGPQVEIVNGKIVLRESSLMVPVHGPVTHEDFEEVEEGIHPTAKYSSFTKHVHSHTWGLEETKQFYEAMRQCGTDFSLMQAFFPHRTRKQLKLKFSREEKKHPALVKATLNAQLPLDLAPFEVHLGTIMPVASLEDESLPAIKKQKKSDDSDECGSGDDATIECSNECGGDKVADSRDHTHHSTVHSSGTPHSHSGATATLAHNGASSSTTVTVKHSVATDTSAAGTGLVDV